MKDEGGRQNADKCGLWEGFAGVIVVVLIELVDVARTLGNAIIETCLGA